MNFKNAAILPAVLLAGLLSSQPGWCHDHDDYNRGCRAGGNQSYGWDRDRDRHDWRDMERMQRHSAYRGYNPGYGQGYGNYNQGYNNVGYGYNNGYNGYNNGYNNVYSGGNYGGGMPISYRVRSWLGNF